MHFLCFCFYFYLISNIFFFGQLLGCHISVNSHRSIFKKSSTECNGQCSGPLSRKGCTLSGGQLAYSGRLAFCLGPCLMAYFWLVNIHNVFPSLNQPSTCLVPETDWSLLWRWCINFSQTDVLKQLLTIYFFFPSLLPSFIWFWQVSLHFSPEGCQSWQWETMISCS